MKLKFVDTNIFLEALVRTGSKSDQCLKLLEDKNAQLWTTEIVIVEVEWVLRSAYQIPKPKIIDSLKRILNLENLQIENQTEIAQAIGTFEEINVEFTDCLNFVKMIEKGVEEAYSFDRDFEKFQPVKRIKL